LMNGKSKAEALQELKSAGLSPAAIKSLLP